MKGFKFILSEFEKEISFKDEFMKIVFLGVQHYLSTIVEHRKYIKESKNRKNNSKKLKNK